MLFLTISYEVQLTVTSYSIAVEAAERRKEVSGRGTRCKVVGLRHQSTAKCYVSLVSYRHPFTDDSILCTHRKLVHWRR